MAEQPCHQSPPGEKMARLQLYAGQQDHANQGDKRTTLAGTHAHTSQLPVKLSMLLSPTLSHAKTHNMNMLFHVARKATCGSPFRTGVPRAVANMTMMLRCPHHPLCCSARWGTGPLSSDACLVGGDDSMASAGGAIGYVAMQARGWVHESWGCK